MKNKTKTSGTYTLARDIIANSSFTESGDPSRNVTINGNGYKIIFTVDGQINIDHISTITITNITLDGNNTKRFSSGITNEEILTITNSTIENFNNTSPYGGVIYNNGTNSIFTYNTFINNIAVSGDTLYMSGIDTVIANNTYFNNSIAFANKTITSIVNGSNVLIIANITLLNPEYYDSDILNKTNYTLCIEKEDKTTTKVQEGNSTFNIVSLTPPYNIYETLSIAQSTFDNYKTNNITISLILTNTTINAEDIMYGEELKINGITTNLTNGTLNVTVGNTTKVANIINNKWNTTFTGLSARVYIVNVTFTGDSKHEAFTNTTTITVNKKVANTTIEVNDIIYGENVEVSGVVDNTQVKILNVTVNEKTNKVAVEKDGRWTTTFTDILPVGEYLAIVTYTNTGGNYSDFINETVNLIVEE